MTVECTCPRDPMGCWSSDSNNIFKFKTRAQSCQHKPVSSGTLEILFSPSLPLSLSLSLSTPFPRQAQVRAMSFPLPNSPCRARIACRLRGSKGGRDKLWHGDTNELRCCIYLTWGKAASRARPRRDRMDGKGHKGLGWVELSWVGLGWVGLGWDGFEVVILIILIIWYVGWVCSALKGYSCSGRGFREDRCWVYSHRQGATFARAEVRFSHPR